MRIIGIDPGKTGGIAWLDCKSDVAMSIVMPAAVKMPEKEADISERIQWLKMTAPDEDVYAFIEAVHAMPATRDVRNDNAIGELIDKMLARQIDGLRSVTELRQILSSAGVGRETKIIQGAVGIFTFGQGYGFLRGCLRTAKIPFESIRPQDWQAIVGCRTRGDKNVSKNRAIQFFRQMPKITHAIADALLIAEAGRRMKDRRPER